MGMSSSHDARCVMLKDRKKQKTNRKIICMKKKKKNFKEVLRYAFFCLIILRVNESEK